MSRLSEIAKPPKTAAESVGPHQFRKLGSFVLAADDAGRFAFLSAADYRRYLQGLKRGAPLRENLSGSGLLRDAYDFDAAAQWTAEKSLLSWPGPSTHVLRLGAAGRAMSLQTARRAVDFAFSIPGAEVCLELACDDVEKRWNLIWFVVQYARRQEEWRKRRLNLTLRITGPLAAPQEEFVEGHRVELRADGAFFPGARRVIAKVDQAAGKASAWIDELAESGVESVLLEPGTKPFMPFYEAALDRMLQLQGRRDIREERALGFLSGKRWLLPGHDVLAEFCYAPDGRIFTSELASTLDEGLLKLGELGAVRFDDLAKTPAVRAVLAASLAENQPMCGQCAYRAFCSVPPSENLRAQGTVWGRHPASARCALHMQILDVLFSRLARVETAEAMRQWLG